MSQPHAGMAMAALILLLLAVGAPAAHAQFDPDARSQEMLELLNRMRMDPQTELGILVDDLDPISSPYPTVQSALTYFGVDGNVLASQWSTLTPVAPLAWNQSLSDAAHGHTLEMILHNAQSHQLPGEPDLQTRVENEGYTGWSALAENVYAYSLDVIYGHAGFAIDWGFGPNGIQDPPGHRENMMNGAYREVGIAIIEEQNLQTQVGPLVITQDFGNRFALTDSWLLGTAFEDMGGDGYYTAGDGIGQAAIIVTDGVSTWETTTLTAGSYQLLLADGTYDLMAYNDLLGGLAMIEGITITGENLKVDITPGDVDFLPGDLDLDGEVSFLEAGTVVANIGLPDADWFIGDFNATGAVDLADAEAAVANLPAGQGAQLQPALAMYIIPEPASAALLALAGLFALRRRRAR